MKKDTAVVSGRIISIPISSVELGQQVLCKDSFGNYFVSSIKGIDNMAKEALLTGCDQWQPITSLKELFFEYEESEEIREPANGKRYKSRHFAEVSVDQKDWEVALSMGLVDSNTNLTAEIKTAKYSSEKCPKCGGKTILHIPDHVECESCGMQGWDIVQGVYHSAVLVARIRPDHKIRRSLGEY